MEEEAGNIQAQYYATNAISYDAQHLAHGDEHYLALHHLEGLIKFNNFKSILDIGAGTGRAAIFLKEKNPDLKIISIEPVEELREIAHSKGLSRNEILDGNVYKLDFDDSSFDLVCAFGVFHHLASPDLALNEMLRVTANSIYISDSNNFGQGNAFSRIAKIFFNRIKIWNLVIYIRTAGRKYSITEGDGLAYSFSLFSLIRQIGSKYYLYFFSTVPSGKNLFRTATHVAVMAQKK